MYDHVPYTQAGYEARTTTCADSETHTMYLQLTFHIETHL